MPQVGFEFTIPVFERANTVHALDQAVTVIGKNSSPYWYLNSDPSVQQVANRYTDPAIPGLVDL
jgi:hypothetical protein